jgi:hypothetical protein
MEKAAADLQRALVEPIFGRQLLEVNHPAKEIKLT